MRIGSRGGGAVQTVKHTKRELKRNRDLVVSECRPWATDEQFELLAKYLSVRHPDGGMSTMDELDYADMVEHTPVTSTLVEYREPTEDGSPGKLVGACLTDRQGRWFVDDLFVL